MATDGAVALRDLRRLDADWQDSGLDSGHTRYRDHTRTLAVRRSRAAGLAASGYSVMFLGTTTM